MSKLHHHAFHRAVVAVASVWLSGCAGTTSMQESHPLIASAGSVEQARVYFIRPNPGFRGVMDRPLKIRVAGAELLSLAKGQYALLLLQPRDVEMEVASSTVTGPENADTPVSTTTQLTFSPGSTQYLVFKSESRGFVPIAVSRDQALEVVRRLKPIGAAVGEPIQ